jgi:hypothetical protein
MARHKRLEEIRNIRNWTVGHPTKVDRYETRSHHAIQRPQLGRGGFSLYSAFDDGREQYTFVPLSQLARLQRRVVSHVLRDMLTQLNTQEQPSKKPSIVVPKSAARIPLKPQPKFAKRKGIPVQQPPRFRAPSPWKKSGKKRARRVVPELAPALMLLPGEKFARSPAA